MRYRSQSVAYPYFVVALLLFGLQMVFGLLAAAKYLGPDPLLGILPCDVVKAIHTNLLLVWLLTGFMGATYYLVPEESRVELYSVRLAYVQLVIWTAMGVTAVVGYVFGWTAGNKLLEQPLPPQDRVVIGCEFLYNIFMTIRASGRLTRPRGADRWPRRLGALYRPGSSSRQLHVAVFYGGLRAPLVKASGDDPGGILAYLLQLSGHRE